MKVILLQDIRGQGKKGQLVEVSDGYARNFLFPRKLAQEATADNVNTMRMNDKAKQEKEQRARENAAKLASQLREMTLDVYAKGGGAGRLFGSVTTQEISTAIREQYGYDIAKTKLVSDPIKAFGSYDVKCKLGYEITGTIKVTVEPEE